MITIKNACLRDFSISLGESPLVVTTNGSKRTFTSRNGSYLFVTAFIEDREAVYSVGEIVEPVFVLSVTDEPSEILASARDVLRSSLPSLTGAVIHIDTWLLDVNSLCDSLLRSREVTSMSMGIAVYALEQALLLLASKTKGIPLSEVIHEYISGNPPGSSLANHQLRLNTMINIRHGQALPHIARGCVKLKVGSQDPHGDANLINYFVENMGNTSDVKVRLDANQMWTREQALEFTRNLSSAAIRTIEYIEEPVGVVSVEALEESLCGLRANSDWNSIPIALDESLRFPGIDSVLSDQDNLRIVFKASLHGMKRWREIFRKFHDRVTITCTFETGFGLMFLCALGLAVNPSAYHGITSLPVMNSADRITCKFYDRICLDGEGLFVRGSEIDHFFTQLD